MTDEGHRRNPFEITKAVDFSDEEIVHTWVDLPGSGFFKLANPANRMPLFLLGGKGSGRTHLMRYFSAVSQAIRHSSAEITKALATDGYLGIYVLCSGLNSGRFAGKGQTADAWADVFAYYTDLWLAQHVLGTLSDTLGHTVEFREAERQIATNGLSLLDLPPELDHAGVNDLNGAIHKLQRELDIAINNAAITRELPVTIRSTRGALVFGLPGVIRSAMPSLSSVQFTYMLDELENLTESQQRYINTLLREKREPCGFMIGSRLYGVRTRATYASDEENKEGSEFENVHLDRIYLREKDQYAAFCRNLVGRRLTDAGYIPRPPSSSAAAFERYFDRIPEDPLGLTETAFLLEHPERERAHLTKLRRRLTQGLAKHRTPGIKSLEDIDRILAAVSVPQVPLIEKLNTFLLYQDWYRRHDLLEAATALQEGASKYIEGATRGRHATELGLFRSDLVAQLLREHNHKQRYFGLSAFIHMSSGLPRNLVIILKNVFRAATFNGEDPFGTAPISLRSQREGVLKSANWFYDDAPGVGTVGREAQAAIDRIAGLLRNLRFADKPAECSLVAFSVDLNSVTDRARATIRAAEQWSMLVAVDEGQRDRNSGAILRKFQLSSMLAPRWDLPIYRRGTLALRVDEANAIFDLSYWNEYDAVVRTRVNRLTAPFFGARTLSNGTDEDEADPTLF